MPFFCKICNKSFANIYNLRQHEGSFKCEASKSLVNGKHPCPHCNAKFGWPSSLKRHISQIHFGDQINFKAFPCGICGQRFNNKDELLKHRAEFHTNNIGKFETRQCAHGRQACNFRLVYPAQIKTMDEAFFFSLSNMRKLINSCLDEMKHFKIAFIINVELEQRGDDDEVIRSEVFPFRAESFQVVPMMHLLEKNAHKKLIARAMGDMERNLDEFIYQGSGWIIVRPLFMDAEVVRIQPLSGGGECGLHFTEYKRNYGIFNNTKTGIQDEKDDGLCFYHAVATYLRERELSYLVHTSNETSYDKLVKSLTLEKNVEIRKIESIENDWKTRLNLDIAIHIVYCDESGVATPLRASPNEKAKVNIALMFFHTRKASHYSLIRDPYTLFSKRNIDEEEKKRSYPRYICYKCFTSYYNKSSLSNHETFCRSPSGQIISMPEKGDRMNYIESDDECFREKAFESGYILIFDFETLQSKVDKPCSCTDEILENTQQQEEWDRHWGGLGEDHKQEVMMDLIMEEGVQDMFRQVDDLNEVPKSKRRRKMGREKKKKICPHKQRVLNEQDAFAYSYVLMRRDGKVMKHDAYIGNDAAEHFIRTVLDLSKKYIPTLSPGTPMEKMSKEKRQSLYARTECHICGEWMKENDRVLDHDHLTGKFVGTAHNECNLRRREVAKITCFSHNMSGYDSHLIIQKLHKFKKENIHVEGIPLNTQKFKMFSINKKIVFLDSLAFLPDSLDKLVENLKASGSEFPLLNTLVRNNDNDGEEEEDNRQLPKNMKDLLLRKGVYPYSFATSIETLENCKQLPSKDAFYNDLNGCEISNEDYEHAKKVWKVFECENMLDYTSLYVKSDVLLLAECVADLRQNIWNEFGLDMCAYFSLPMLAKDIMLKYTGADIELISDKDMSNLLQANIRGGLSFINKRYAYETDENGKKRVLLYIDANNLYGDAMTFPLPYQDFRWMRKEEMEKLNLEKDITTKSGERGYIFEVDLEYPEHLHLKHSSFPLAPHSMEITEEEISPYSKECMNLIYGKKKHKARKLVSSFKTRYKYNVK